jgi:DeoR/GlpR family transcriptional regulator of sugar metabolism
MWAGERHRRILNLIASVGRVEAETMAEQLHVSRETIRRDLKQLEQDGRVRRVHGGAIPVEPAPERPFRARRRVQVDAKRRIGQAAAPLLRPGQSCFIDAGTTTAAFASALARIGGVFVITNSVEVAAILRAGDAAADIVLLGGRFGTEVPATHGELTIAEIGRFRADVAVLSPVGVDPVGGVTYHLFIEAEIARTMMRHAGLTLWLADHTKLGQTNRAAVCACPDIHTLVTDAPAEVTAPYRAAGVGRVITAKAKD